MSKHHSDREDSSPHFQVVAVIIVVDLLFVVVVLAIIVVAIVLVADVVAVAATVCWYQTNPVTVTTRNTDECKNTS